MIYAVRAIRHYGMAIGLLWSLLPVQVNAEGEFNLRDYCPAGFRLDGQGCYLQNQYTDYASLQNSGVGGLKTGLPELRQGFTPRQIDLGRLLFFDPILSGDHSMSCASCHDPSKGFSDGRALSVGSKGQLAKRSAPSLWNVGFLKRLFWDGRASSLEEQMLGPLYDSHEMANSPAQLLADLRQSKDYRELFAQAFNGDSSIQLSQVYTAIAAFESSLVSLNSRYDLYAHGYHEVLNQAEIEGMNIFRSFVARCAECHTPPLFSNQQIAVLGTPEPEGRPLDPGAAAVSGDASQRGGFKVPSLRNVALTAPYMHSGRFATLRDAAEFYTGGRGHAVPAGEKLSLHWHIWEPNLTDDELDRLVDFMATLTDETFMPQIPQSVPSGLEPVIGVH